MSHVNKKSCNSTGRAGRVGAREAGTGISTEAEYYLAAGNVVRWRLRRGCRSETIARAVGLSVVEALFALLYAESSPALILRSLVEDWSWEKIKDTLRQRRRNRCAPR